MLVDSKPTNRRFSSVAQRRRSSGFSNHRLLSLALEAANTATHADLNLDYKQASKSYKQAIESLREIIQRSNNDKTTITSAQLDKIQHYHLLYQQRLQGLEATREQTLSRIKSSQTLFDPKARRETKVRHTSLSKIPFVEDVVPRKHCKRPPSALWRRPYWLLKNLQSSVNGGGFVAPSIYVSALVWSQKGAKISGLQHKMSNYQNIYENLNVLSQLQLPSDGRSWRTMHKRDTSIESLSTFEHGLSIFLDSLIKAQNALAHSLTYVHKAEGSVADHKQGIFKRAITKVSKVIERTANESITKRASSNSLQQYAGLIACIGERVQFIDGWLSYFECPNCKGKSGAVPPGVGTQKSNHVYNKNQRASQIDVSTTAVPRIHRLLERIGHGLRDTICMVVWKDLQELLERFVRKSKKSFVSNLEWEEKQIGTPMAQNNV